MIPHLVEKPVSLDAENLRKCRCVAKGTIGNSILGPRLDVRREHALSRCSISTLEQVLETRKQNRLSTACRARESKIRRGGRLIDQVLADWKVDSLRYPRSLKHVWWANFTPLQNRRCLERTSCEDDL